MNIHKVSMCDMAGTSITRIHLDMKVKTSAEINPLFLCHVYMCTCLFLQSQTHKERSEQPKCHHTHCI